MKYNRYMSHFIPLVHINLVVISTWQLRPMHICMLQVARWCWYTIFAYYSCCIEMTLIVYIWLVSSRFCRSNLSCYTCPHISCSGIDLGNLHLELWRTGTWTHIYGILQIGIDLYNKFLGNTYVKSWPQLGYSDSIFTLKCTFLAVNEVKMTLDLWPVHTLQHNTKIVSGLDIRRKWWKLRK